jgi:hypothetical protein
MIGRQIGIWTVRGAGLASVLLLGGCTSVITGVYGGTDTSAPSAVRPSPGPNVVQMDPDAECPQINVPTGASAWSGAKDAAAVRYQAVLSQFARECVLNPGNDVTIRIGVEGRVLLGEHGASGTYTAPLRIAVRDRSGSYVYNRVSRVTVSIPPGETQGTFKIVDDAPHVVLSADRTLATYDIQVGFGGDSGPAPRKKRRG